MFDETTIFYKVNFVFPLLVFTSLALALAIRRKYMRVILCTLVYWTGLHFYYAFSTTAGITLPGTILSFAPQFWLIGRMLIILLYLVTIVLYVISGKGILFRTSYGIMLALVISEHLYGVGSMIAWDSACEYMEAFSPDIVISFEYFNVAAPLISSIALALALGIRKKYVWAILIGMTCWAWISYHYMIFPFVFVCFPGFLLDFQYWTIARTLVLVLHLVTIALYMILNKRHLFWVSYGLVIFLVLEQYYSYFWGEYFGP